MIGGGTGLPSSSTYSSSSSSYSSDEEDDDEWAVLARDDARGASRLNSGGGDEEKAMGESARGGESCGRGTGRMNVIDGVGLSIRTRLLLREDELAAAGRGKCVCNGEGVCDAADTNGVVDGVAERGVFGSVAVLDICCARSGTRNGGGRCWLSRLGFRTSSSSCAE
jgi:hypothetical protein